MKKTLIIFVKTPVKGRVKTRMQPDLTPGRILGLYKSFIKETINKCTRLNGVEKVLGCYPTCDNLFLRKITETYKMKCFNQNGSDLGEKMVNAFKDYFKKGYSEVVIIGSDSPTLPLDYIKKAFSELRKNDFVLGPCCDGGLYLVGAKKKIKPGIFRDIPWDTTRVQNRTFGMMLEKLNSSGIRFSLLPFWYDIDTDEDLKFFRNHIKYLKKTKR